MVMICSTMRKRAEVALAILAPGSPAGLEVQPAGEGAWEFPMAPNCPNPITSMDPLTGRGVGLFSEVYWGDTIY